MVTLVSWSPGSTTGCYGNLGLMVPGSITGCYGNLSRPLAQSLVAMVTLVSWSHTITSCYGNLGLVVPTQSLVAMVTLVLWSPHDHWLLWYPWSCGPHTITGCYGNLGLVVPTQSLVAKCSSTKVLNRGSILVM